MKKLEQKSSTNQTMTNGAEMSQICELKSKTSSQDQFMENSTSKNPSSKNAELEVKCPNCEHVFVNSAILSPDM
jgi:hypothetical protein